MTLAREAPPVPSSDEAEALFPEARRRRRRIRLVIGATLLVFAGLGAGLAYGVDKGGTPPNNPPLPLGHSGHGSIAVRDTTLKSQIMSLPHEELQIRKVGNPAASCPRTNPRFTPPANSAISIVNKGAITGCIELGPAIMSIRSVPAVVQGYAPAGGLIVSVELSPGDAHNLETLAAKHFNTWYAVVLLGKMLRMTTGGGLTPLGPENPLQLTGGSDVNSPLPKEVSRALRSPLRIERSNCDLCFG